MSASSDYDGFDSCSGQFHATDATPSNVKAVKHRWSSPCYFTQKHTFETRRAKAPCLTYRIRERMFQGAKVPCNFRSWERKFHLWYFRSWERAKVRGNESSSYPVRDLIQIPVECQTVAWCLVTSETNTLVGTCLRGMTISRQVWFHLDQNWTAGRIVKCRGWHSQMLHSSPVRLTGWHSNYWVDCLLTEAGKYWGLMTYRAHQKVTPLEKFDIFGVFRQI